jgi:hypothetical protein
MNSHQRRVRRRAQRRRLCVRVPTLAALREEHRRLLSVDVVKAAAIALQIAERTWMGENPGTETGSKGKAPPGGG